MCNRCLAGLLCVVPLAVAVWFAFDLDQPPDRRASAREGGGDDSQIERNMAPETGRGASASLRGVVGRVTAFDRGLAGASVYLRVPSGVQRETTDAEGRFRFVGIKDESGTVSARALGYAHSRKLPVTISTDLEPVEIRMGVGARIEGRVVSDDGVAIGGADVGAMNGLCASLSRSSGPPRCASGSSAHRTALPCRRRPSRRPES